MFKGLAHPWSCFFVLIAPAVAAVPGGSGFLDDYEDAVKRADKAALPIVVEFSRSDACETCQALDKDVFRSSQFRTWSKKAAIFVTVDFPERKVLSSKTRTQNDELKERFKVEKFPTVVVLTSDGKEAGRLAYENGEEPDAWMTKLIKIVDEASGSGVWITDFERAKKLSKATNRPILADFTGSDWCSWCIKLKKEVFDTDEFREWARKNVVLVEFDFPRRSELPVEVAEQNEKLKKEYGIQGFPTILFLDHKGRVLGKYGYDQGGPENWIKNAEQKMK